MQVLNSDPFDYQLLTRKYRLSARQYRNNPQDLLHLQECQAHVLRHIQGIIYIIPLIIQYNSQITNYINHSGIINLISNTGGWRRTNARRKICDTAIDKR